MERSEQYSGSIITRGIAQNHKFRRKSSFKETTQKQPTNQTTRQVPAQGASGQNQLLSEPIRGNNQQVQKTKALTLPTTKTQQNSQQYSQVTQTKAQSFNRRKSLSKQIKSTSKNPKENPLKSDLLVQNDSVVTGASSVHSAALQLLQDHGYDNSHSQNAQAQNTMFMTFQTSEKNFKRRNNASSQEKNPDSARGQNGGNPGGFLPDIYMSNNKSLKNTPDPKRTVKKSKQFMLIEEHSKNIKKNSDEELGNYFNFKESKFISTSSTEPSDDQLLYKVGHQQFIKTKATPKNAPTSETRKVGGSAYGSKVISIPDSQNGVGPSNGRHSSAFDNYYNMIISPKQSTSTTDQVILSLQSHLQNPSKPSLYDQDTPSVHSSLNSKAPTYKFSDGIQISQQSASQNAYQSPNVKGQKQLRKVSFEESLMAEANGPQISLYPQGNVKENFSLTAQLSTKINSTNLSKLQLSSLIENTIGPGHNPQNNALKQNPYYEDLLKKSEDISTKRVIVQKHDIKLRSQKQGQKSIKIYKQMRQSSENLKSEETVTPFRADLNYELFLQPKTDRVFEFHSKRVEFRRRPLTQNNQVLIMHFDGVIGEIIQKNLNDDNYQMMLRHGAIEGLQELSKHFQIVIYTMLNERYCRQIIDLFDREEIVFDAVYQRLKAFKRSDEHCNYNQIYLDFDIHNENDDVFSTAVQTNVLVILPICMENDDIKDKDGEDLLFQEKLLQTQCSRNLTFKGLPIDSQEKTPMILLVPHLRSQVGNYSVSMLNISNILQSLLVASCIVKEEQLKDIETECAKEKDQQYKSLREEEHTKQSHSRSSSPKRSSTKTSSTLQQKGLFMMTITTISPKNHFKKILATTKDKVLDQKNCNWFQAFHQVKKYKLFSLKTASTMKLFPEFLNKKKEDEILKLKQTIFKLKALLQSHIDKASQPEFTTKNSQIQELFTNNEWVKTSLLQYKTDYYHNLVQILQDQSYNPLKDLIKDLEDRLKELDSQMISSNYTKSDIPLYRFLVLQGHQFQNYPLETKMIIKEKETNLQRNLFNWVVQSSRNYTKRTLTNPLVLLNGQTTNNSQHVSQMIQIQHDTQCYRIFSDQYQ